MTAGADDTLRRFTGLADLYARCRPDYPDAAVDYILSRCGLGPGSLLIDVGSGTGISSRLFAGRGLRVVGVEPNADMRARAEAERVPEGVSPPAYRDGRAEATGLPDGEADAVLAAQAFHWFDPDAALAEFHRVLRPGGWVVLLWNERDHADSCTAAFGAVVGGSREAASVEGPRREVGRVLFTSPWFESAERRAFSHEQVLDEDGLLGRAFSTSYAPREPAAAEAYAAALRRVFRDFARDGRVRLRYETAVYLGRRAERLLVGRAGD